MKDADIPCICKRRGAGEILEAYMGVSWLGADLYVPTALLDKAKNTVAIFTDELHHIEPQGSLAVGRETAEPQRRKAARWIAAVYILSGVVPGIIVVLLWLLGVRLT